MEMRSTECDSKFVEEAQQEQKQVNRDTNQILSTKLSY